MLDIEDSRSGSSSATEEDSTEEEMLVDITTNQNKDQEKQSGDSSAEGGGNAGRNLFGSAKDAVINIVKKAAEALGSPQKENTAEPAVMTKQSETEKEEEKEEIVHLIHVCHSAAETANVSRAVNGSLSCQWDDLTFLASLDWLHPHVTQLCWSESSDVSYQSPELLFARAVWGSSTVQALCYWVLPEEFSDDSFLPSSFELVLPLPSSGLTGEIDMNLTPSETMPGAESDCQAGELLDIDNLEEQLFSESGEEMDTNGAVVEQDQDMVKMELTLPEPTSKPTNPPPQQHQQQQQQQKESVFVRLSNRIKVLERNMSLSGQYLEELSRRYKRQVDDMQKSLNRTLQVCSCSIF